MRRASLIFVLLFLSGCTDEAPISVTSPTPNITIPPTDTPTTEASLDGEPDPPGDETPYVVLPEIGDVAISSACQFERRRESIFRADLANGGQLQLRKLDGGSLHASAIPAPGADPVGTQVPADSDWTESGGWLSGTSVMWLAGTENRISVEYHVRWDETIPQC